MDEKDFRTYLSFVAEYQIKHSFHLCACALTYLDLYKIVKGLDAFVLLTLGSKTRGKRKAQVKWPGLFLCDGYD